MKHTLCIRDTLCYRRGRAVNVERDVVPLERPGPIESSLVQLSESLYFGIAKERGLKFCITARALDSVWKQEDRVNHDAVVSRRSEW